MNSVSLVGRLAHNPEYKTTEKGFGYCKFSVAVESKIPDKITGEKNISFINCVSYGKIADFINSHVEKGRLITLCGELRSRSWINQDNTKGYVTEVIVEFLNTLDRPKDIKTTKSKKINEDKYIDIDINDYNPFA